MHFYPRSPCGERLHRTVNIQRPTAFLSTLSLRRATISCARSASKLADFYPRSPCGERRHWSGVPLVGRSISIHALLAESDENQQPSERPTKDFYPRSPCGERLSKDWRDGPFLEISIHALLAESDRYNHFYPHPKGISIHALLAESDGRRLRQTFDIENFYPRSPCGERRLYGFTNLSVAKYFYPRSPCGERPFYQYRKSGKQGISIHALLAESD